MTAIRYAHWVRRGAAFVAASVSIAMLVMGSGLDAFRGLPRGEYDFLLAPRALFCVIGAFMAGLGFLPRNPLGRMLQMMGGAAVIATVLTGIVLNIRDMKSGFETIGWVPLQLFLSGEVLFVLLALALMLQAMRHYLSGQLLVLVGIAFLLSAVSGNLDRSEAFLGLADPQYLLAGVALTLSVLLYQPHRGALRIFLAGHRASGVARLQLCLGIAGPAIVGILTVGAVNVPVVQIYGGLIVSNMIAFNMVVIVLNAVYSERSDISRRKLERALARQALRDGLTGLFNRVMLRRRFDRAVQRAQSDREFFSLLIFDLDYFKKINDMGGHEIGDQALVRVAHVISDCLEREDTAARLGGEEFAVILRNSDMHRAELRAEQFRQAIAALQVRMRNGRWQYLTTSIGIAQWMEGESFDQSYARADAALYHAKAQGRNRVCVAPMAPVAVGETTTTTTAAVDLDFTIPPLHLVKASFK
ncbi:GGDEF domain-containing protein [Thioclava litoralis]|uniref:diguanylate cyclase n=1 Tax=Thioclava litoralis TaxID=3076557 RepID=A0ABZ1E0T8_9RHOB|nr:GGDEF domain-containing protein [Thioclava sp. FTW29]